MATDIFVLLVFSSIAITFASEGLLNQEKRPINIPDECPMGECSSESRVDSSMFGVPGVPGIPGVPGAPGSCGRPGAKGATGPVGPVGNDGAVGPAGPDGPVGPKGERGEKGSGYKGDIGPQGPVGEKGDTGLPGIIGPQSPIGPPGPIGPKGDTGPRGPTGENGDIGPRGPTGARGAVGPKGPLGVKGEPGEKVQDFVDLAEKSNWKQCAWNKGSDKDSGLIQSCIFNKKYSYTSLRIYYGGTLSLYNCDSCCKRWYFTFDGAECDKPMPIDAILYMKQGAGQQLQNIQRHRHVEGYCHQIPKGQVRIGFWVEDCPGNIKDADAFSGWISVSRIVIQEVPPPQK